MSIVHRQRSRAAAAVRTILSGSPERRFIPGLDNDGLFGPGSVTWIIHADASMLVGGIAALLLQTLHPSAMAAVAQHSDYRTDPLGRLRRTVSFIGRTTYGTRTEAEAAIAQVNMIHSRVAGTTDQGVPYRADDPHLLAWVHATETWAFLAAHRAYGAPGLDDQRYDAYVREMGTVGAALGVVDPPGSTAQLAEVLESFAPELAATVLSDSAVRFLRDLAMSGPAGAAYRVLFDAAALLQPAWAAPMQGLHRGPLRRRLTPPAAHVLIRAIGWALADDDPGSVSGAR